MKRGGGLVQDHDNGILLESGLEARALAACDYEMDEPIILCMYTYICVRTYICHSLSNIIKNHGFDGNIIAFSPHIIRCRRGSLADPGGQ